jgi:glycerophosphoryl diester phosphodiesterase
MLKASGKVLNIAHRGASAHAPENTLAAFRLAVEMRADGIELDVRLSADGRPVVFHDEDMTRLFGRSALVSEKTVKALRLMRFSKRFGERYEDERIPTLEEALEASRGMVVNIELKGGGLRETRLAGGTVGIVRNARAAERVIISSFNPLLLAAVKKVSTEIALAFLFKPDGPAGLRGPGAGFALGVSWLNPHRKIVDAPRVGGWHRRGLGIMAWTADETDEMKRLIRDGCDAVITNHPDRLAQVLNQAGKSP